MIIAIASGKGGTGKTTVASNLAAVAAKTGLPARYLDCDVEEPNGHLFLKPAINISQQVTSLVPEVDESTCEGCGACARICRFGAIVCLAGKAMAFNDLCHSCGGCTLVCPTGAISEVQREIGEIEAGSSNGIGFIHGRLRIGEPKSPPLIRKVLERGNELAADGELLLVDAPPGSACPAVAAIRSADLVLLVAESTPFGLHDLKIAVEVVKKLKLSFAVVINRHGMGDDRVEKFCRREGIEILEKIPDDRRIAEAYSRGELIIEAIPEYRDLFLSILEKARSTARSRQ